MGRTKGCTSWQRADPVPVARRPETTLRRHQHMNRNNGYPSLSKHFNADDHLAGAYAARHESLGPLAERAGQLIELRKLFREAIPEGLAEACEVANLRQDTLIVLASTSACAAKLKQLSPRLAALLQKRGWQVNSIKITVQGG